MNKNYFFSISLIGLLLFFPILPAGIRVSFSPKQCPQTVFDSEVTFYLVGGFNETERKRILTQANPIVEDFILAGVSKIQWDICGTVYEYDLNIKGISGWSNVMLLDDGNIFVWGGGIEGGVRVPAKGRIIGSTSRDCGALRNTVSCCITMCIKAIEECKTFLTDCGQIGTTNCDQSCMNCIVQLQTCAVACSQTAIQTRRAFEYCADQSCRDKYRGCSEACERYGAAIEKLMNFCVRSGQNICINGQVCRMITDIIRSIVPLLNSCLTACKAVS